MGKVYPGIDERLAAFIRAQRVFFVATAPLSADGHVNVSPKGLDAFRILAPNRVAYLDLVGSGIETVAHLRENARIVFMFCAFEGPPKTLRLHARGRAIEPDDPEWSELAPSFLDLPGRRCVIVADIERVADSCGYGVPLYEFAGERSQLGLWAERKGGDGLLQYKLERNQKSIDGLAGLRRPDVAPAD